MHMTTGETRRLRAAIYLRLSDKSEPDGTSLETQERDLRILADRMNADVVAVYVDDGFSGSIRQRPDYMNWLNEGRTGTVDLLLAWHSDRISREGAWAVAELQDVIEGKNQAGKVVHHPTRFATWDDRLDSDTETFDLVFGMLAIAARQERKRAIQRAQASQQTVRLAGRWHGGTAPFGYRTARNPAGPGYILVHQPVEVSAIRKAASDLLLRDANPDDGKNLNQITREWNANPDLKPRVSASFTRATLLVVMRQEALLGRMKVHGVVPRDEEGRAFAPFEPVLDLDTWHAVRRVTEPKAQAHRPTSRLNHSRELSGVLVCGGCGRAMTTMAPRSPKGSYRCQTRTNSGLCPTGGTVLIRFVEPFVEAKFLAEFGDLPVTEKVAVVESHEASDLDDRISALLARMATAATADDFAMLQSLQAEKAESEAVRPRTVITLRETGQTYGDLWLSGGKTARRDLVRSVYHEIRLLPASRRGLRELDPARLLFGNEIEVAGASAH